MKDSLQFRPSTNPGRPSPSLLGFLRAVFHDPAPDGSIKRFLRFIQGTWADALCEGGVQRGAQEGRVLSFPPVCSALHVCLRVGEPCCLRHLCRWKLCFPLGPPLVLTAPAWICTAASADRWLWLCDDEDILRRPAPPRALALSVSLCTRAEELPKGGSGRPLSVLWASLDAEKVWL